MIKWDKSPNGHGRSNGAIRHADPPKKRARESSNRRMAQPQYNKPIDSMNDSLIR